MAESRRGDEGGGTREERTTGHGLIKSFASVVSAKVKLHRSGGQSQRLAPTTDDVLAAMLTLPPQPHS